MATVEEKSGKRDSQVDLNIVPFIDLMSVCIIFLLITAVWTQVSMIQIGSSIYAKRTESGEVEPPSRPQIAMRLDVNTRGYVINLGKSVISVPKIKGDYDEKGLLVQLRGIREKYPKKDDCVINVLDKLTYKELITGMDLLLTAGFVEVAVASGG